MANYTPYQSQYFAHRITLEGVSDDAFAKSLSTARVEMNPHQVDAALFALQPPIPRGAILADEVGLGKTIEASLVIAQRWGGAKTSNSSDCPGFAAQTMDAGAFREIRPKVDHS
jgi:hypothetical protein